MRLIITVHGIRTYGHWQERLERLTKERMSPDEQIEFGNYKFGYFSFIGFFFARWLVIKRFRKLFRGKLADHDWERIDLVGHSFGTHIIAWALKGMAPQERPKVHTIILSGSVLRAKFPWEDLLGSCVQRVVNDCGANDWALVASQFLVPLTGMAGRMGFDAIKGESLRDRFSTFGHSGYFQDPAGTPIDDYMRDNWLPLLLTNAPIPTFDLRPKLGVIDGIITTLAKHAELFKLVLYVTPVVAATYWINDLYRNTLSGRLTEQAQFELDRDPGALPDAMWLALQAYALRPSIENQRLLRLGVDLMPKRVAQWNTSEAQQFRQAVYAPSGELVVVGRTPGVADKDPRTGELVVVGDDQWRIVIRDPGTGALTAVLIKSDPMPEGMEDDPTSFRQRAVLSASGKRAAMAQPDGSVFLIDLPSGEITAVIDAGTAIPVAMALDHSGDYLVTVSGDQAVTVWSTNDGARITADPVDLKGLLTVERLEVGNIAVTHGNDKDPVLIAVQSNTQGHEGFLAWVIDISAEEVVQAASHEGMVEFVEFDPSGTRLVTGAKGIVHLIDLYSEQPAVRLAVGGSSRGVAFDPSGRFVATLGSGPVRVWDSLDVEEVARLNTVGTDYAAAFTPDGSTLAVVGDAFDVDAERTAAATMWDLSVPANMRRARLQVEGDYLPKATAISPDGTSIAVVDRNYGGISVHDLQSGGLLERIGDVKAFRLAIGGIPAAMTALSHGVFLTWTWPDLEPSGSYKTPRFRGGGLVLSLDGRLFASRVHRGGPFHDEPASSLIEVWRVNDGSLVARFKVGGRASATKFSPDGNYLVVGVHYPEVEGSPEQADEIILFDLTDPKQPAAKREHKIGLGDDVFSFSSNGGLLAVAGFTVIVLDVPSLGVVEEFPDTAETVGVHPTGAFVATLTDDGLVKVRRMSDRIEIARMSVSQEITGNSRLEFTPDPDGSLLVGSMDGTRGPWVWEWSSGALVDDLCERLVDDLSPKTWSEYCAEPSEDEQWVVSRSFRNFVRWLTQEIKFFSSS